MKPLEERLSDLAEADVPSPASPGDLRRRTMRRRRNRGLGGAALALALVTGAIALSERESRDNRIDTVDDVGLPGGSPSTTPTTGTPSTPSSTATHGAPAPGSPVVVASAAGVVVFAADGTAQRTISEAPAAVAYALGPDLVAFQESSTLGGNHPTDAEGPVLVWRNGDVRDLPLGQGARRALLLDADVVGSAPVALISERYGEVGPDDTFEELVLLDVVTGVRTTLVRRDAWESGTFAARILPGGNIIAVESVEGGELLVRWDSGSEEPAWTIDLGGDSHVELAVFDGRIRTIQMSFSEDFTPVLAITDHDPATGEPEIPIDVVVDDPDRLIETGLVCAELLSPEVLACSRANGGPLAIDLADGSFTALPGGAGAVPTVVRST